MMEHVVVRPARDLFRAPIPVFDAVRTSLTNPLVYTNAGMRDRDFRRRVFWRYAARQEGQPAVLCGWYENAFVNGDGPFFVLADGGVAAEHIPFDPLDPRVMDMVPPLLAASGRAVTVDEPCAFVCNPGLWVWGHWLLEILPRAVLAMRVFGGSVRLAMPRGLIDPAMRGFLAEQVLASLHAYGIDRHQLFPIEEGIIYRFRKLADFSGVDGLRHPGVLQAVKNIPGLKQAQRRQQGITAVLRGGAAKRGLTNRAELAAMLDRRGAGLMDPASAPFAAQVMAFRESEIIVGDMGSNLCAALYAPPGTGIVTLAPDRWDDGALPRLLQDLDMFAADLRGAPEGRDNEELMWLPHHLSPAELTAGLDAVRDAVRDAACDGPRSDYAVQGRTIARTIGRTLLEIRFGADGNAAQFRRESFSQPEPLGEWSLGPVCSLTIDDFSMPGAGCWLRLEGAGYASPPRLPETTIAIEANGTRLGEFDVAGDTRVDVKLPKAVLEAGTSLRLRFHHPRCVPPAALGISADVRPLGFFFYRVCLHAMG